MACVYLDEQGRCAIYEKRPMGCRKFECDRMSSAKRDMRLKDESLPLCLEIIRNEGESEGGRGR
jgi:Fe-S-cluster containining protein